MPKMTLKQLATGCVLSAFMTGAVLGQATCRLDDETQWSQDGWTGHNNDFHDLLSVRNSDWHGLKRITNFERFNEPCRTEAVFGRMPNAVRAAAEVDRASDTCGGNSRDEIEVGFDDGFEGGFITGIQAWTSDQRNTERRRLKGLRVEGVYIEEDCSLTPFEWDPETGTLIDSAGLGDGTVDYGYSTVSPLDTTSRRNNADEQHEWTRCPDGWIASGLRLAQGGRGVSGVRLQCREVVPR